MKLKNLLVILVLLVPTLFSADKETAPDETSSYVKFITTIFGQDAGEPADFFLFLGRFHPLILHLPVGMVVIAFFMSVFAYWKKREDYHKATLFVLGFGFITACGAVLFGSFLSMSNEYDVELIDRHGWGGLTFAILVGVTFLVKYKFIKNGQSNQKHLKIFMVLMSLNVGLMSFVGHDGGSLTHGKEYLFKYAPNWIRSLAGFPPKPTKPKLDANGNIIINRDESVYLALVKPFMEKNCYECHASEKQKGGLRLDSIEFIMQGGKNKETKLLVHGDAEKSLLYQLMVTEDSDEVMPPKGKLPELELEFIKWWIDSSKNDQNLFERTVNDANVPEKFLQVNNPKRKVAVALPHATKTPNVQKPTDDIKLEPIDIKVNVDVKVDLKNKIDFVTHIAPIFETRCVSCHGEKKQKGDYRLDKAEHFVVAGESEKKPVVSGKPAESHLLQLIKLAEDHDEVMPPKGGTLTTEQIALIERWISEGASYPADITLQDKAKKE